MKVVYVAGPFRANTPWGVEQNVHKAEGVAAQVALSGAAPLCPHTMYRHYDKMLIDEFWLDGTLELLRRCDAIMLVNGWEGSSGSVGEEKEAQDMGIPVFEDKQTDWVKLQAWAREDVEDMVCMEKRPGERVRRQGCCPKCSEWAVYEHNHMDSTDAPCLKCGKISPLWEWLDSTADALRAQLQQRKGRHPCGCEPHLDR